MNDYDGTDNRELEQALIDKVLEAVERKNGKKGWIQTNYAVIASVIIGIAVNMIMIGVSWGNLSAASEHNRAEILRVDARVAALEVVVRTHHDDLDRHMNKTQLQMILDKLTSIELKVDAHIRQNVR
jgi:hypothetical protein